MTRVEGNDRIDIEMMGTPRIDAGIVGALVQRRISDTAPTQLDEFLYGAGRTHSVSRRAVIDGTARGLSASNLYVMNDATVADSPMHNEGALAYRVAPEMTSSYNPEYENERRELEEGMFSMNRVQPDVFFSSHTGRDYDLMRRSVEYGLMNDVHIETGRDGARMSRESYDRLIRNAKTISHELANEVMGFKQTISKKEEEMHEMRGKIIELSDKYMRQQELYEALLAKTGNEIKEVPKPALP